MTVLTKREARLRRRRRVRARVVGTAERPRLSVYWTEPELRELGPTESAKKAGELLAERGKAAGIETCVFDRGGYQYHGRVRALAEGAREGGLAF